MSAASTWPRAASRLAPTEAVAWAAAAALLALPRATSAGTAAAACGAAAGAIAGRLLAATALRVFAAPAFGLALAGLAAALAALLPRAGFAAALAPLAFAGGIDAAVLALLAAAVTLPCAFGAGRRAGLRPLPALAVVLAAATLLAAHRGGAIHLPYRISDEAWSRGTHPILALAGLGLAAGAAAALALFRARRTRWPLVGLVALLGAALLLAAAVPALGLFEPPMEDPLGLSGKPDPREGSKGGKPARPGDGRDPLGLSLGDGRGGTGQDQEMAPFRDDYESSGAQSPVAVVVLHDDVEPAQGAFYFRQTAFSSFNGRRLVRSFNAGADDDLFLDAAGPAADERAAPPGEDLRTPLAATMSLVRDHVDPPVLEDGVRLTPRENADPSLFKRTYDTDSLVLTAPAELLLRHEAGNPAWPEPLRRAYLELPPDPRYVKLAREIRATLRDELQDDPYAMALAIGIWLERNAKYSLHSKHAAAEDPTASFLFGDRIGYCVHLAHATAYLARALGVPSRVAAGYAYTAKDRAGGSALLLRAGDAHAWAEVYLDGAGWIPVDPSPPSIDPPMAAPNLDLQRMLGEMARPRAKRLPQAAARGWQLPSLRTLLLLFGATFGACILSGYAVKGWRRAAPRVAGDRAGRAALRAALDRVSDAGLVRRHGETRERFARRAAPLAPDLERLTALHLAARLGRREADPRAAAALARAVCRTARRRGGLRARLETLRPFTWLRVR